MPGLTNVRFDPSRLTAAIKSSFPTSVEVANADASARLHNKSKSSVESRLTSSESAVLYGTGLASVFESGRHGGYEIKPLSKGTGTRFALKFVGGDGGFAASAVGGPMRAYPAMGPASRDWAVGGYQKVARTRLAASGFGGI